MEITLDAIISLIGLFVGGGAGAFFTWRYQRRKARAEAEQAEVDAAKELQGMYQTMLADANEYLKDARDKVEGLRQERDHYKQERNEMRDKIGKMEEEMAKMKKDQLARDIDTDRKIAKLGRKVESMSHFLCGDLSCKMRQRVVLNDTENSGVEQ
jgi:predicted RNase H-like nuclease (RuvC/YqgF family)